MPSGHVVGEQCVDVAASADLYWSQVAPGLTAGVPNYLYKPSKGLDGWFLQGFTDGVLVTSVAAPPLNFPLCDAGKKYADLSVLLGAVVGLWVVALCGRMLYRFFTRGSDGS